MSTPVLDNITNRNTSALTAFMTRIENEEPVDNISVEIPLFDELWKRKKVIDGGRQGMFTLDTAFNDTIEPFNGYDTFNMTPPDTVRPALYAYINYGGSIQISWEEQRENANKNVRTYDRLKNLRKNAIAAMKDTIDTDLLQATAAAKEISNLPTAISSTSSFGEINPSTETWWVAQEDTTGGAFAATGISQMRTLWNDVRRQGQGTPDLTLTTQAIFESYEAELEPDLIQSKASRLEKGAESLIWKMKDMIFDAKVTSGELYYLNFDHIFLEVDSAGMMQFDEFLKPSDQKAMSALFAFRGQLVVKNRRGLAKATGIT